VFTSMSDEQRRFVAPSATSRRASSVSAGALDPVGEHASARRAGCPRHGGAGRIWRARPPGQGALANGRRRGLCITGAVRTPAKLDMIDMRQAAFEKITCGVPDIDADKREGFRHGFTLC